LHRYNGAIRESRDPPIAAPPQDRAEILINAREVIRCEREQRSTQSIIRIVRLKPNGAGGLRAAGPLIEFADKHLPGVIAILQMLLKREAQ
jgi:hypothetical protein